MYIADKRAAVKECFMKESNYISDGGLTGISIEDIRLLFWLYDTYFLDNFFKQNYNGRFLFSVSSRMTRTAGKTIWRKDIQQLPEAQKVIEIRISFDFIDNYDKVKREKTVNGIIAGDKIEALMLIIEHEICHAIEVVLYGESSCAKERFQTIAKTVFGHTSRYHQLPTKQEMIQNTGGAGVGDQVCFLYKCAVYHGIVTAVNKRATVMVPDKSGRYVDRVGIRYTKVYVPVHKLKKINHTGQ